jgi:octaprenyl-diphosphate synthase
VDALILRRLRSDVVLINQIGQYIVQGGGKRLRPIVVLLAARACGYAGDRHVDLAAVIELIHTATLLHDDVVDGSELRRNRETANALWGNEASVLVGDFLYSRSFEMMVAIGQMRILDVLSHATNRIAEGEVLQLLNCNDPDTNEAQYLEVIARKTATLFRAGTHLGAVLADGGAQQEHAMTAYGQHLGIAFQLVDDALDYSSDNATLGKSVGDDLAEGKPTLPLIRAMAAGTDEQRAVIRKAIVEGGREQLDGVLAAIESTGSIGHTIKLATEEAQRAKESLQVIPDSPHKEALRGLADFAVSRSY